MKSAVQDLRRDGRRRVVSRLGKSETRHARYRLDDDRSAAGYEIGLEAAVPGGWRTGPTTFDRGPHATSRVIQFGDMVYGSYCGATYMGYGSCTYRTFIVGRKPTRKEKDWYKVRCAIASTR